MQHKQTNLAQKNGDVKKKVPDITGLVATTVLNAKIRVVENKVPDVSGLKALKQPNQKFWPKF